MHGRSTTDKKKRRLTLSRLAQISLKPAVRGRVDVD
jgi:hypothetical protein